MGNANQQKTELFDAAVAWLNEILPRGSIAERTERPLAGSMGRESNNVDGMIDLQTSNGTASLVVVAKQSVSPRDVQQFMAGLSRTLRRFAGVPVLVIAPWLSERTQDLLRAEEINYIDLTGNAWIALNYPTVVVRTVGSARNPDPPLRQGARLRGPKAGRLVRTLVDVRPPYGVRELAGATELTPGYVSRLLDSLDRDALVDRSRKGEVVAVDYPALLRRWVNTYDVLKSNEARRFIAPEGAAMGLKRLKDVRGEAAVTGSFAAVRWAPVAAPALLLVYVESLPAVVDELNLLEADEGANVVLLRPFDHAVWQRGSREDGVAFVAPSQAAADCLTGTGRMPSEGEALVTWMTANEDRWRAASLRGILTQDREP
jgi:hypothetical protein